jgi:DNA-binding MarR family transcriptional regulator
MPRRSDEHDIYGKPGHLIRRLQQIAVAIFMTETAGFEITPVQYSALLAVRNHPGIDQTALTRIIAFDRSTIGEVLGRLEAKRLVKRGVAKRDRRARVLYITAEGRRLLARLTPRVNAAQKAIMAPLGPAERAQFMQIMRRLVDLNNDQSRVPLRIGTEPSTGATKSAR